MPEYWVVDLTDNRVLIHPAAGEAGYRHQRLVPFGEPLHAATVEGLTVETAGLG